MKRASLTLLPFIPSAVLASATLLLSGGCTPSQPSQPVTMAPPISAPPPQAAPQGNGSVYQWQDVPAGQQVPVTRAVFDQGGYQIYAQSGETILVPFANQNLYVMKFGISDTGAMYFVQDGTTPTLFVPRGTGLENASAQGARWYPFSQDYQYQRPVYVGIAPSWNQFTGMGWYPGMSYYGGYWGYNPYGFSPMAGIVFNIGGHPYYGWNSYSTYYRSNPGLAMRPTRTFNYASTGRQAPGSFGRNRGTGSFGGTTRGGGGFSSSRPTSGGTGSFGSRRSGSGSGSGGFSSAPPSGSGGFGRSSSGSNNTFGTATNRPGFGSGSSGTSSTSSGGSSGFGGFGRRSSSGGSFGGSTSGSSSGYRPFGGGSTRSSGGSFGGGSFGRSSSGSSGGFGRSSGGGSFGGGSFGRSSGGGGFGGRRR